MKHRLVKFIKNTSAEQCTQTEIDDLGIYRKEENEICSNDVQGQEKDSPEPENFFESIHLGEGAELDVEDKK